MAEKIQKHQGDITADFLRSATVEEFLDLIESVEMATFKGGFILQWAAKDIGFGEMTIYKKDHKVLMNTEYMPQNFVEAVLIKFARRVERFDQ